MTLTGVYFGVGCQKKTTRRSGGASRSASRGPDQSDKDQAHWVQISTPMCGKTFGWWMIPDIDDVVAVSNMAIP
jgi:Type VI secretion system/phage-baseplate injector OB domain